MFLPRVVTSSWSRQTWPSGSAGPLHGSARKGYNFRVAAPKTIFDDADEAIEAMAVDQARSEIAAGRGIPHEQVGASLRRLAAGEDVPPPIPS